MKFGVLKDIKADEYRVIATPAEVAMIARTGAEVWVQKDAGKGAGFSDEAYAAEGAKIVDTMEEIYANCDFVAKVKELEEREFDLIRENQIIFTCIHPAAHPAEVDALLAHKAVSFAAEDSHRYGSPNCEAAGKIGAMMGLNSLLSCNGGKGKFVNGFGGAPGVHALVIGAGTVGRACVSSSVPGLRSWMSTSAYCA